MKTQKLIIALFLSLQLAACASTSNSASHTAETKPGTLLCIQSPCVGPQQTFLEALAAGFGAGLGFGMGTAITKSW